MTYYNIGLLCEGRNGTLYGLDLVVRALAGFGSAVK